MTDTCLQGSRVQLRPAGLGDRHEVQSLWTLPEVRKYLFDDRVLPSSEVADHLHASEATFAARGYGLWLVRLDPLGEPVGFSGLLHSAAGSPNLVVGMAPGLWGRGLAREAASLVIDHAFSKLGLEEVHADVDEPNVRSVRLLESLGFELVRRASPQGRPLLYYRVTASRRGLPPPSRDPRA